MHGDRPVYRFNTGRVFGRWTLIYADTGEPVAPLDRDAALSWLKGYLPEQPTLRYDAYLQRPDTYTRLPAMQTHFPLHRVALDDARGHRVLRVGAIGRSRHEERSTDAHARAVRIHHAHVLLLPPEVVVERAASVDVVDRAADVHHRRGHRCVALRPVTAIPSQADPVSFALHRMDEVASLRRFDLFGVFTITWVFSGLVSLDVIPGIRESRYSPQQIAEGARSVQGEGAIVDLSSLAVENLKAAASTVSRSFAPKELELLQFGSEPYLIAYRPPTPETVDGWSSRSGMDFITPTPDGEHVLVSPLHPDRTFPRFDDDTVMRVARDAMPGVAIRDAAWLNEYDDYYYKTVSSFDLGLPRMAKTLPVLRVRYEDAAADLAVSDAIAWADSQSREPRSRESVGLLRPSRVRLRVPVSLPAALGHRRRRTPRWCRRFERDEHRARISPPREACSQTDTTCPSACDRKPSWRGPHAGVSA